MATSTPLSSLSDHNTVVMGMIQSAMGAGKVITLHYKGETRVLEPHALGLSKAFNPVMRAFDVEKKGWRLFNIDDVEDVLYSDMQSHAPRILEGYVPNDKGMVELFAQV